MRIIIHYAEIALKGGNRRYFENILVKNCQTALQKGGFQPEIQRQHGRIVISLPAKTDQQKISNTLKKVFGIKYFYFAEESAPTPAEILKKTAQFMRRFKKERIQNLGLITRRADKKFPLTSVELNVKIGQQAHENQIKINFSAPEKTIYTEIGEQKAWLSTEKIPAAGGLPVSSSGKVLCLFSGGIDSAVAAYLMMKRGCSVDFIHFHSFRTNSEVLNTKIKAIIQKLSQYQIASKLFLVPYHTYQLQTAGQIPEKLDLVSFKNFMWQTAQEIALKNNYKALVNGDSLGQVASQTLENIAAIDTNINIPVFRPLISFDKEEIIAIAKQIGTYENSIKEYKDCCSIIAKKPETRARRRDMLEISQKLNLEQLIRETLNQAEAVAVE